MLVDFWTYTCINWLRTLALPPRLGRAVRGSRVGGGRRPHARVPLRKRHRQRPPRRRRTCRSEYPIAIDSDYAIWQAFANRYWPAIYIADSQQAGSGTTNSARADTQNARWSSSACCGRPDATASQTIFLSHAEGFEAQADWANLESPETYLGYEQGRSLASPGVARARRASAPTTTPDTLKLNQWALSGDWAIERSGACVLNHADGRISFRFHARDVHLVMGPRTRRGAYGPVPRGSRRRSLPATVAGSMSTTRATAKSPSSGSTN